MHPKSYFRFTFVILATLLAIPFQEPSQFNGLHKADATSYYIYLPIVSRPYAPIPPGEFSVEMLGQYGGAARTVVVEGQLAYLGVGTRLIVLDISDSTNPMLVGQSAMASDSLRDLAFRDGYIYAAAGHVGGLLVFDVHDPGNPIQVSAISSNFVAEELTTNGNYLYLAAADRCLFIYNLDNPATPQLISTFQSDSLAEGITVSNGLAYLADYYAGLKILDVHDPSNPLLIGSFQTSAATGVAVDGPTVYVADSVSGLSIIDASSPASPTLLGQFAAGSSIGYEFDQDVKVSGGFAYLADQDDGLRVLDIRVPNAPKLESPYALSGDCLEVAIQGKTVYVTDRASGLHILDVNQPVSPVHLGLYSASKVMNLTLSGNLAYVASAGSVEVYKFNDAGQMSLLGTYLPSNPVINTDVEGTRAYILEQTEVQVIDFVSPTSPKLIDTYLLPQSSLGPRDLAVSNRIAYIVGYWNYSDRG